MGIGEAWVTEDIKEVNEKPAATRTASDSRATSAETTLTPPGATRGVPAARGEVESAGL
jgi:hypothetical protein